jgi:hypothetical protein
MNPLYQNENNANLYPCPKCDKGLMKVRHHLCPCDQDKVNATGVVKVRYGTGTASGPAAGTPAGDGAASTTTTGSS